MGEVWWSEVRCCSVVMFFWFFLFYRCVYGCMFCILLFTSVSYVFLLSCLCIIVVYALLCYSYVWSYLTNTGCQNFVKIAYSLAIRNSSQQLLAFSTQLASLYHIHTYIDRYIYTYKHTHTSYIWNISNIHFVYGSLINSQFHRTANAITKPSLRVLM